MRRWMNKGSVLAALLLGMMLAGVHPAFADLIFPSLSYRTGPYAPSGAPLADGWADYFTLLNERDGGINGVRVQVPECETGFNPDKGLECYMQFRDLKPALIQPWSSAIAARLLPRAAADGIALHMMGYGWPPAGEGALFPWVFTFPATGWDAASIMVGHLLARSGGSLAGKRIGLLYHNSAYGQEVIPILRELARKHRFALRLFPVDHPGLEQKAAWAKIREAEPEFLLLWGWGIMNRIALEEAVLAGIPLNRMIGNWWSAPESELIALGAAAEGYRSVAFHGSGTNYPLFADLRKYVLETGKAAGEGTNAGTGLYNLGLYAAVLASESVRAAMRLNDTTSVTQAMIREGMERLVIDRARMKRLGLPDFGPEIRLTCLNHGGPGSAIVREWDAARQRWRPGSAFLSADRTLLDPLLRQDAATYARSNRIVPADCAP